MVAEVHGAGFLAVVVGVLGRAVHAGGGNDAPEDWRNREKQRPPQPDTAQPPLGADPHEDWRLRQKTQDVQPVPKKKEEPGFLEKVGKGVGTALSRTWDELAHNEKLHQGVEAGGRMAWEATKWNAGEVARQVRDNADETARIVGGLRVGGAPGGLVTSGRENKISEAHRRTRQLEIETQRLAERMKRARDQAYRR